MDAAIWEADLSLPLEAISVGEALRERARSSPEAPALYWEQDTAVSCLRYGELLELATDVAWRLLALAHPGERVAIWSPNSVEWALAEYGAALAGIALVPVNPALTDAEVRYILELSEVAAILTVAEHRDSPLLVRARTMAVDLPSVRRVVDMASWRDDGAEPVPLPEVAPTDPLLLQFTTGTTGTPKGAILSHSTLYNASALLARTTGIEGEVACDPLPYHHLGGSAVALLGSLSVGGAVTVFPGFDTAAMMRVAPQIGTTSLHLVPTMAVDMLARPDFAQLRLPRLRTVMTGGALCTPTLLRRIEDAFGVPVLNAYGQTESTGCSSTRPSDGRQERLTTVGRPLPQREVRITRPGSGEVARVGEVGELEMRSTMVMDGYFKRPEATNEVRRPDGWLRTGDLASLDARGYITLHGRLRDVIVRGGENVYPKEIELAIMEEIDVEDVAVFGVPHERWGEEVAAAIRVSAGQHLDVAELDVALRRRLARFKVPTHYRVVEDFPLLGPGKVDKRELRARFRPQEPSR